MKATRQNLHRVLQVREGLQRLLRRHFFKKNHLLVLYLLKLILDYQTEPESKKQRTDESDQDDLQMGLQAALQEVQEGYVFEIELDFTSNRQKKQFQRNPEMFLAKKLNSSEVHWENLNQEERRLMNNAKGGEVSSFLKTQAVRCCLTYEEQQEAQQSDRVLRARWVLVWKPVPEVDRAQAKADRLANPDTTVYDENLTRKAKARIVSASSTPTSKMVPWSLWPQFRHS